MPGVERVEPTGDGADGTTRARLFVDAEPATLLAPVTDALRSGGVTLVDVGLGASTLEDVSTPPPRPHACRLVATSSTVALSPPAPTSSHCLFVTGRDVWIFLAQVLLQPLH